MTGVSRVFSGMLTPNYENAPSACVAIRQKKLTNRTIFGWSKPPSSFNSLISTVAQILASSREYLSSLSLTCAELPAEFRNGDLTSLKLANKDVFESTTPNLFELLQLIWRDLAVL